MSNTAATRRTQAGRQPLNQINGDNVASLEVANGANFTPSTPNSGLKNRRCPRGIQPAELKLYNQDGP